MGTGVGVETLAPAIMLCATKPALYNSGCGDGRVLTGDNGVGPAEGGGEAICGEAICAMFAASSCSAILVPTTALKVNKVNRR